MNEKQARQADLMTPEYKAKFYRRLQDHISEGLVFFIGSGLSCGEGLPSMFELSRKLAHELNSHGRLDGLEQAAMDQCRKLADELNIKHPNLEAAIDKYRLVPEVRNLIESIIVESVGLSEKTVIASVIAGSKALALTGLLLQLPDQCSATQIVTTNYDRLIELAAQEANLGIDTLFAGSFYGILDKENSKAALFTSRVISGKRPKSDKFREVRKHVRVLKPHGSLDWFRRNNEIISYPGPTDGLSKLERLIVAPGANKYREGYETVYDIHRNEANQAIRAAKKLMIIGYGFGDDHLEKDLVQRIKQPGVATVVLCKSLTPNAKKLLQSDSEIIVLQELESGQGTRVFMDGKEFRIHNERLWDISEFTEKVLKP